MTDFFEYMLDHKSEEQWETWQRDGKIERTYKDLITDRRFDPSFSQAAVYYPANVTGEKKQQLGADLEAIKAKLKAANLYEAVLDKGNGFFLRDWTRYVTITDELFLLPWLHYCVLDYGKLLMEEIKHDGYRHLLPLKDEHMLGRRTRTLQPDRPPPSSPG